MPLYTVTIVFEDRTYAIEQVEAQSAEQALEFACKESKAFAEHGSEAISAMVEHRLMVYQVAEISGVWNWHQRTSGSQGMDDVFGGIIVQTDPNSPKRQ